MTGRRGDNCRGFSRSSAWLIGMAACLAWLAVWPPIVYAQAEPEAGETIAENGAAADGFDGQVAAWRMRLTLPVTAKTHKQVRRFAVSALDQAAERGQRALLILEFHVVPGQSEYGRGSEFGASYELAKFLSGEKLAAATTVAFVPSTIQGHAVLVALACDEIVMAPDAEIGPAGIDEETISNTIRVTYEDIAGRKRRVPGAAARALVDPALELLRVETEYSTEYITRDELADLAKRHAIDGPEEVLIPALEPGRFTGREARRHGFVSYLGENLRDVARAMNVRPETILEDPALGANWIAARVDLTGRITGETVNRAQRMIEDAVRKRGVNFVCLWIDSEGGNAAESARLAVFLASVLDPAEVRTVAYVPKLAGGDAALIALACDELVIAPRAVLGGPANPPPSPEQVKQIRQTVRETLAPGKSRSWSLPAAIIDPELEVFAYERLDDMKYVEYFSEEEAAEQSDPKAWAQGERLTTPGEPFSATGSRAVELFLASHEADDFAGFKRLYGLEHDPALLEPTWADFLIEALASPQVAVFLLVIGFAALYVELQIPGIGLGGFCATVCFIVFFWSRFLGGTADWLEIILFLAGVCFLLIEVFVLPGFGIFGLGGGLMVLASIVLASQTFVLPQTSEQLVELKGSLLILTLAGIGTITVIMLIQRWLPTLSPAGEAQEAVRHETMVEYDDLVGVHGRTTTKLTPSGKARLDGRVVDVIAHCEALEAGREVEVVEVRGNRVFVRPVG